MENTIFLNNENAVLHTDRETPFFTFPALSKLDYIGHGFSTRLGGVSKGYFSSMNLGYSNGDRAEDVEENYRRICQSLGLHRDSLVLSHQVHDTKIRLVTEEDKGKGILKERDYEGIDGLITDRKGITLVTFYADCVPLFFVDKKNRAIGLSHSGWKGTVSRMGKATLTSMEEQFGTNPEDVTAVIGPSICGDCYEVSEDVAQAFQKEFRGPHLGDILTCKGRNEEGENKYQLNLWEANRRILLDTGVPRENIHISGVCTCCNPNLLFSHRASGGKRGILAAFLTLKV